MGLYLIFVFNGLWVHLVNGGTDFSKNQTCKLQQVKELPGQGFLGTLLWLKTCLRECSGSKTRALVPKLQQQSRALTEICKSQFLPSQSCENIAPAIKYSLRARPSTEVCGSPSPAPPPLPCVNPRQLSQKYTKTTCFLASLPLFLGSLTVPSQTWGRKNGVGFSTRKLCFQV